MDQIVEMVSGMFGPLFDMARPAGSWLFDAMMSNPTIVASVIVAGALLWLAKSLGGAVGSILTSKPALLGGALLFVVAFLVFNR